MSNAAKFSIANTSARLKCFLCAILFLAMSASAQESPTAYGYGGRDEPKWLYWMTIGGGISSFSPTFFTGVSLEHGGSLFTLRYAICPELKLFIDPAESIWDVGLLYGSHRKFRSGSASVSAGLAYVGNVRRGRLISSAGFLNSTYESITSGSVGIPFEAQLFWVPGSGFGIGASLYGDISTDRSFVAFAIALRWGFLE